MPVFTQITVELFLTQPCSKPIFTSGPHVDIFHGPKGLSCTLTVLKIIILSRIPEWNYEIQGLNSHKNMCQLKAETASLLK